MTTTEARPLVDAEARRAIREDLGATLVVEAAAGTGKTTELVARVVALLRGDAARLGAIVAVTFTEKAAGEMKLRLRGEIERARTSAATTQDERARFDLALAELEVARIGTIHSLCADVLREHPVEAGVDPLFEVAAGDEAEALYASAFDPWFQAALADPTEGVRRILRRRPRGRDATGPRQLLYKAGIDLLDHRDFDAAWRRDPFDRVRAIDDAVDALRAVGGDAGLAYKSDDFLAQNLAEVARFLDDLDGRERVRGRDHDGLEAELRELVKKRSFHWKGGGRWYGHGIARGDVLARRDGARDRVEGVLRRADADLAACLSAELAPLVRAYQALLEKAGKLDFLDLLVRTRDLLANDAAVRARLQDRTSRVLVDEFQDTDPLQAEILLLLAAEDPAVTDGLTATPAPGKLFVVGDPKQSIYRFRRADVALYEAIKRRLVAAGARVVNLSTSFRSAPSIQAAVNAAFAPLMRGAADGSQAAYVALEAFRGDPEGRPTVIALPVPAPYGDYGKVVSWRVEASLPDAVGAFVDWLVRESGWRVTEREGAGGAVPVEPRHVCLLFKRFQAFREDVTRPYVRALEARGVPHVLVGGRSYHQREEVLAVRNALAAIERPDDELRVYATLHGPLFAFSDDVLLAHRAAFGGLHPLRTHDATRATADGLDEVVDALSLLARLHAGRNRRPIADTLSRLLGATRAHAGIAIWPTGEQALANLLRVIDLARRFEAAGATSFRAFVDKLEGDAESGNVAEAPVVEEGTDGVRLMTVHRAKGLEFPVVILVDPTAQSAQRNPSRWVSPPDRLWSMPLAQCTPVELDEHASEVVRADGAEAVRLAYVAATRARDLLVVPTCGDEPLAGWLDVLAPIVTPHPAARRKARPAPGCPAFGPDSVKDRPANVDRGAEGSVAPGLHRPQVGTHEVVWWDPSALDLGRESDAGLRQQRILEADEGGATALASEQAHAAWQARRSATIERGSAASVVVRTPTDLAADAAPAEGGAAVVVVDHTDADRAGRPRGKRFGTLVHGVLSEAPFDADRAAIDLLARAIARHEDAPEAEVLAAVDAAIHALAHPLLRRAAAASSRGECRREAPITQALEDGAIVDGTVDLAFREAAPDGGAVWTVVDFKTDVEIGPVLARYEAQVRIYARAITAATGEPARAVLLSV